MRSTLMILLFATSLEAQLPPATPAPARTPSTKVRPAPRAKTSPPDVTPIDLWFPDAPPAMPAEPMVPMAPMAPMTPMVPMAPMTPMAPMAIEIAPLVAQAKQMAEGISLYRELEAVAPVLRFDLQHDVDARLLAAEMRADRFDYADGDRFRNHKPRQGWASDDPADSLYRVAREALNRGEYRRAAQLFNEVSKRFPKSAYAPDCAYWEAFSRYRIGTTDELRTALKILEGQGETRIQLASMSRESSGDVPALRARIQGALAARGDREAAAAIQKDASDNSGCDREEVSVRAEALSALGQMDRASAMPVVKKVLARRDECSVELRRRALFVLAREGDKEGIPLLVDVAKNDPDPGVRGEAMAWLPRVAPEEAIPVLEEMLRTSNEERVQRSAINALSMIEGDKARKALRAIIERPDASERLRREAIFGLMRERNDRGPSPDDVAYIRALYSKAESDRVKETILSALSRNATTDNQQFILSIARNQNEAPSLRASAVSVLGRMSSVSLDDFVKLYDVADARSLREQVLYALFQRKDPEALDKMMEIARKDTDPQIRRTAISLLARRNDPRATKLLQELIDK